MTTPTSKGVTWGDDVVVRHPADSHCIAAAAAGFYDPWADEDPCHAGQAPASPRPSAKTRRAGSTPSAWGPRTRGAGQLLRPRAALGSGPQQRPSVRGSWDPSTREPSCTWTSRTTLTAQRRTWRASSARAPAEFTTRRISTRGGARSPEGEAPDLGDDESAAQYLESRNEADCDAPTPRACSTRPGRLGVRGDLVHGARREARPRAAEFHL